MKIFPAILDSRPAYLEGANGCSSLLLSPMGAGTLLCELHTRLSGVRRDGVDIAPTFEFTREYEREIRHACSLVGNITPISELIARCASYDLTDRLLICDAACFPLASLDWRALASELGRHRHGAMHLVALDTNPGGTTEGVQLDRLGHVRRIQRYYDARTWAFTRDIVCSIVPASALITAGCSEFHSLAALRHALILRGIPSRDIELASGAVDLGRERGLLWLSERCILAAEAAGTHSLVQPAAALDRTATFVGPVVVHARASIEADARVIGPAAIGAGARVGRGAIVAQCLVAPGAYVPAGAVVRHRVLSGRVRGADDEELPQSVAAPVDMPPTFEGPERPSRYRGLKLVVDTVAAVLGLIMLSPLLAFIAVLIKIDSRGPVLYADWRETLGGRLFRCWKFRTMYQGADARQRQLLARNEMDGPQFKIHGDPRVTRVGRWLRKCSFDELPQLMNVAVGDMSLVGPRPSPFRENQICVPWRDARLSVRAGITGLWQVCREKRGSGDFHQWIQYDMLYVENMSALVDFKILLTTVLTLGGFGRVPVTWILPGRRAVPISGAAVRAGRPFRHFSESV